MYLFNNRLHGKHHLIPCNFDWPLKMPMEFPPFVREGSFEIEAFLLHCQGTNYMTDNSTYILYIYIYAHTTVSVCIGIISIYMYFNYIYIYKCSLLNANSEFSRMISDARHPHMNLYFPTGMLLETSPKNMEP